MEYRTDQVPMSPRSVQGAPGTLPIRDHLPWSIFNLFYMNVCCLGLTAMIFSVKSRDRKVVGDVEGARHYGSTARSLNIAATVLGILLIIILIGLAATGTIQALKYKG
uniref:Dispanin subfamily A member 2b n=1 Tax=Torpedo marmorata TaxID=7788 RepID=DSA2B_TORMA|nr:RecName: Full=Dispanin subfamily A member 2b; Short=DSPA2b; AltName: Full=14 kDa transmembrane protein [Torpedo marmorata]AAC59660.1 14 kDa transmembrane protein [Torpedo marmorata]